MPHVKNMLKALPGSLQAASSAAEGNSVPSKALTKMLQVPHTDLCRADMPMLPTLRPFLFLVCAPALARLALECRLPSGRVVAASTADIPAVLASMALLTACCRQRWHWGSNPRTPLTRTDATHNHADSNIQAALALVLKCVELEGRLKTGQLDMDQLRRHAEVLEACPVAARAQSVKQAAVRLQQRTAGQAVSHAKVTRKQGQGADGKLPRTSAKKQKQR